MEIIINTEAKTLEIKDVGNKVTAEELVKNINMTIKENKLKEYKIKSIK